eukprot:scaffold108235_cov35-Tisochrysis_lutea.AAC.3
MAPQGTDLCKLRLLGHLSVRAGRNSGAEAQVARDQPAAHRARRVWALHAPAIVDVAPEVGATDAVRSHPAP